LKGKESVIAMGEGTQEETGLRAHPFLELEIEGVRQNCLLDTGSAMTIFNPDAGFTSSTDLGFRSLELIKDEDLVVRRRDESDKESEGVSRNERMQECCDGGSGVGASCERFPSRVVRPEDASRAYGRNEDSVEPRNKVR
jgi:hypothetical protein